jgi:hypothetical protein
LSRAVFADEPMPASLRRMTSAMGMLADISMVARSDELQAPAREPVVHAKRSHRPRPRYRSADPSTLRRFRAAASSRYTERRTRATTLKDPSGGRGPRCHHLTTDPRCTSLLILPKLIFGTYALSNCFQVQREYDFKPTRGIFRRCSGG